MKKQSTNIFFSLALLLLGTGVQAQQSSQVVSRDRFLDTVRLGMRYQVQEFHTLNQKLAESCNCDEGQKLQERSLQGIGVSLFEPLNGRWALGADFGASFGKVMDDARNYKRYSLVQIRTEAIYHLFGPEVKLRPYLSGGVQLVANFHKTFFGFPVGAGLRYSLAKGGYLHVQAAYDNGIGKSLAKSVITNIGFHVPLNKRKELQPGYVQPSYPVYRIQPTETTNEAVTEQPKPVFAQVQPPVQPVVTPPAVQPQKVTEQLYRVVYFDIDKFNIDMIETNKVLSEVYAFMRDHPQSRALLSGHTDGLLGNQYNLNLSKNRAEVVAAWLKRNGILANRITISYYGKNTPATGNETPAGRSGNRRVEILVKQ